MKKIASIFGFLLLAQFSFASEGASKNYKIDASHSNVGFTVSHMVGRVNGEFSDFDGEITFDPSSTEKSKVHAVIKTESVNTNNKKRDEHLRSEEFFAAKKYPTMVFDSTKVVSSGDKKYKVTGNLTMRGVTKPVTLDVEYNGEVKDPWGKQRAGFVATGKINRKDFNINWNKTLDSGGFVVGDDVTLNFNVEAVR